MSKKRNRQRKTGFADTKTYPHKNHPAWFKRKTSDDIDYVTFTHSKNPEIGGKVVETEALSSNIDKSGTDTKTTFVIKRVFRGKRSALGKENDKYRLSKKDLETLNKILEDSPVIEVRYTSKSKKSNKKT